MVSIRPQQVITHGLVTNQSKARVASVSSEPPQERTPPPPPPPAESRDSNGQPKETSQKHSLFLLVAEKWSPAVWRLGFPTLKSKGSTPNPVQPLKAKALALSATVFFSRKTIELKEPLRVSTDSPPVQTRDSPSRSSGIEKFIQPKRYGLAKKTGFGFSKQPTEPGKQT